MTSHNHYFIILLIIFNIIYLTESRFRDADSNKRPTKLSKSNSPISSTSSTIYSRSSSSSSSNIGSSISSITSTNTIINKSDLCTQDRQRKLLCYCFSDDLKKDGNRITKADCWIYQKNLNQNDTIWLAFNQQISLKQIKFTVQPTGQLEYIPTQSLEMLHNLTIISIEYGQILIINGYSFANLPNLELIQLINNQIEVISQNAFVNHEILKELNLQQNHINLIDRYAFRNLPHLKKLYLNSNNLSNLYENIFNELDKLEYLDISYNILTILSTDIFKGLGNLKILKLTHNNINFVGDTVFAELWSLQELNLDDNNIERISQRALDGLNTLKVLNLRGNRIKKLDNGMLRGTPALLSINLQDNLLETLTFNCFEPIMDNLIHRNSELLVTDNNFICDCRLQWIFDLKNRTKNIKLKSSLDDIECSLDDKHQNDILKNGIIPESRKSYYDDHSFKLDEQFSDDDLQHHEHYYDLMKLGSDNLPCPIEVKEPTELPMSRESIRMSDIRDIDIQFKNNGKSLNNIQLYIFNLCNILFIFCYILNT